MRELKIIESMNGYVLIYDIKEDDFTETFYLPVEDMGDEKDCLKRLLEAVADHFGFNYDRFRPNNLNITFDKEGHKYVRPEDYKDPEHTRGGGAGVLSGEGEDEASSGCVSDRVRPDEAEREVGC